MIFPTLLRSWKKNPLARVSMMLSALVFLIGCVDGTDAGNAGNSKKISGVIQDASGSPLARVKVSVRSAEFQPALNGGGLEREAQGWEYSDTTDDRGAYAFTVS